MCHSGAVRNSRMWIDGFFWFRKAIKRRIYLPIKSLKWRTVRLKDVCRCYLSLWGNLRARNRVKIFCIFSFQVQNCRKRHFVKNHKFVLCYLYTEWKHLWFSFRQTSRRHAISMFERMIHAEHGDFYGKIDTFTVHLKNGGNGNYDFRVFKILSHSRSI